MKSRKFDIKQNMNDFILVYLHVIDICTFYFIIILATEDLEDDDLSLHGRLLHLNCLIACILSCSILHFIVIS
jgi:hypothetical protein